MFDPKKLEYLGGAQTRLYGYKTPDAAAVVDTEGYFNAAARLLPVDSVIFATVATGGTPAHGIFVVSENDGSTVDVDDMSAIGGTDTD